MSELTPELKDQLKSLFLAGIITAKEYEKKLNPLIVVGWAVKFQTYIIAAIKYLSLINWKEDIKHFKYKKIALYIIIALIIYGLAYAHGKYTTKDIKIPLGTNEIIHILKNKSVQFETKDGKILKIVSQDDVNVLKNELRPVTLQSKIIGIVGSNFSSGSGVVEGGLGISWLRAWQIELDTFLTNAGFYPIGVSYGLKKIHLPNSSIGIAIGKGFKNAETKALFYFKVNF